MTDALWTRLSTLVPDALERPAAERDAFLDDACTTDGILDAELRAEAAAFVAAVAADDVTETLRPPFAGLAAEVAEDLPTAVRPDRIGPWRITGLLGEGGHGTVYRAERADGAFDREVALKLIRGGAAQAHRLDAERRVLARLEHDGIARLYDGGTVAGGLADGAPYLVMERVDGVPLTDAMRGLTLPDRLDLMLQVCDAVAFAHRHLVVHRDLKPSNVLVATDADGPEIGGSDASALHAKLLDFGIAHLLEDDVQRTRTGDAALTPAYAAPEQLLRQPVTTATDVYALGVLLYEGIAQKRPYDLSTLTAGEAERVVCHETPPALATVADLGHWADLDVVVMTALDKDPARRYASAATLADDLRRVRDGLPPSARPATRAHRARLFVRRHRVTVLAAAAVVLALVGGLSTALWQARTAATQRDHAEARFDIARDAARSLIYDVHDAVENLDGSIEARELVLEQSIRYLDRLSADASEDLELRIDLAEAYYKVGFVQGIPTGPNLGRTVDARENFRRGLALLPPPTRPSPTDTLALRAERIRGRLWEKHATILAYQGNVPGALVEMERAVDTFDRAVAAAPTYDDLATLQAGALINRGDFSGHPHFPNDGRPDDALADYRAARAVLDAIVQPNRQLYTERLYGITFEREGTMLVESGDPDGARLAYQRALSIRQQIVLRDDVDFASRRDLAVSYETLGRLLLSEERPSEALPHFMRSLGAFEKIAASDPANSNADFSLAISRLHVAHTLGGPDGKHLGRTAEARAEYDRAIAILRQAAEADPENTDTRERLAEAEDERARLR